MGSLIKQISSWRGDYSITDIAYQNNKIYAISNNSISISNIELTDWTSLISISGNSPVIISFNNELYISNIYNGNINYDLWKLNTTEDGIDFICYGNDIDYEVRNFVIYNNNLFAVVKGWNGRLVKFNGSSWDIVGTTSENLTDGIVFNGNLCVSSEIGQLYVWDNSNNLISWGSPCAENITKLCIHNNELYAGTTEGRLYLFNTITETWSLICDAFYTWSINDLISYRGYIYAGIDGYLLRTNSSTWEDIIPYKDYYFMGSLCFLNILNDLYIGNNSSFYLYKYSSFTREVIDFTSNKLYDLAPATISFTSNVECDFPVNYLWDFEDGIFSNDPNPIHTFIRGTYDISLILDDGVEYLTIVKENYIDSYTTEIIYIDTIEKLQQIGSPGDAITSTLGYSLRNNYVQINNIDASNTLYWNSGKGFLPIARPINSISYYNVFCGSYDGNNYYINNLYISNDSNTGLFGIIGNAVIKNINLFNIDITCAEKSGGLIGEQIVSDFCEINNCYVTGSIKINSGSVGGIIGRANKIFLNNCITDVIISKNSFVSNIGGIVGFIEEEGSIINCQTYGEIEESYDVGGIIGFNTSTLNINNCVSSMILNGGYVGGIIGYQTTGQILNIYNCSYNSTITGSSGLGGILGYGTGNIYNCSFSGIININDSTNNEIGGIVGYFYYDYGHNFNEIINCISTGIINSPNFYVGFIGGIGGQVGIKKMIDCISTVTFNLPYNFNYAIGGLVGYFGKIEELTNCCFIGNINTGYSVGGLTYNINGDYPIINDCYVIGNITVYSGSYCGGLIGSASSEGEIYNSYYEGNIFLNESSYSGGLIGYSNIILYNCFMIGEIFFELFNYTIGSLCGIQYKDVYNSFAITNISILYGEIFNIGGLFGYISDSNIENCFYKGNILIAIEKKEDTHTGGLIGYCSGNNNIKKCYTIGNIITTTEKVGGLIGINRYGNPSIQECFSLMNIQMEGGTGGGLIGETNGIIEDCYNKGDIVCFKDIERDNVIGGLIGKLKYPGEVYRSYNSGLVRLIE
jgi:hypothetical protein